MPNETTSGGLAALLLAACLLTGCASMGTSLETPELNLVNVAVTELGLLEQSYDLRIRVINPNGIPLPIRGLSYNVNLAGSKLASGVTSDSFTVPANGENEFDITVRTNLIDSITRLSQWLRSGPQELDYEMSGKLQIDLPLVGAIPFSHTGSVNFARATN